MRMHAARTHRSAVDRWLMGRHDSASVLLLLGVVGANLGPATSARDSSPREGAHSATDDDHMPPCAVAAVSHAELAAVTAARARERGSPLEVLLSRAASAHAIERLDRRPRYKSSFLPKEALLTLKGLEAHVRARSGCAPRARWALACPAQGSWLGSSGIAAVFEAVRRAEVLRDPAFCNATFLHFAWPGHMNTPGADLQHYEFVKTALSDAARRLGGGPRLQLLAYDHAVRRSMGFGAGFQDFLYAEFALRSPCAPEVERTCGVDLGEGGGRRLSLSTLPLSRAGAARAKEGARRRLRAARKPTASRAVATAAARRSRGRRRRRRLGPPPAAQANPRDSNSNSNSSESQARAQHTLHVERMLPPERVLATLGRPLERMPRPQLLAWSQAERFLNQKEPELTKLGTLCRLSSSYERARQLVPLATPFRAGEAGLLNVVVHVRAGPGSRSVPEAAFVPALQAIAERVHAFASARAREGAAAADTLDGGGSAGTGREQRAAVRLHVHVVHEYDDGACCGVLEAWAREWAANASAAQPRQQQRQLPPPSTDPGAPVAPPHSPPPPWPPPFGLSLFAHVRPKRHLMYHAMWRADVLLGSDSKIPHTVAQLSPWPWVAVDGTARAEVQGAQGGVPTVRAARLPWLPCGAEAYLCAQIESRTSLADAAKCANDGTSAAGAQGSRFKRSFCARPEVGTPGGAASLEAALSDERLAAMLERRQPLPPSRCDARRRR